MSYHHFGSAQSPPIFEKSSRRLLGKTEKHPDRQDGIVKLFAKTHKQVKKQSANCAYKYTTDDLRE
jgi:hypothetical protein